MLVLWRTNLLPNKLKVIDEVANTLNLRRVLPKLPASGAIGDGLDAISGEPRTKPIGSFLCVGSGSAACDGNPFVTADVLAVMAAERGR